MPRVDYEKLSSDRVGENSASIRRRVQYTNTAVFEYSNIESSNISCNADTRIAEIRKFCKLDETGDNLIRAATWCCAHGALHEAAQPFGAGLSPDIEAGAGNAQHDVADLAGSENIQTPHLAEALQYRPKVMMG